MLKMFSVLFHSVFGGLALLLAERCANRMHYYDFSDPLYICICRVYTHRLFFVLSKYLHFISCLEEIV